MNDPNYQYTGLNNHLYQPLNNYPRPEIPNAYVSQNRQVQNPGNRPYVYQNNLPRPLNIYQSQSVSPINNPNQILPFNLPNQQPLRRQPESIPQSRQNQPNSVGNPSISQSSQSRQCKMDGIFAQSFTSLKRQFIFHTLIVFILLFAVLMLYKFDIFKQNSGYMHGVILEDGQMKSSIVPFLILTESLILLIKLFIYFKTYHKLEFALWTANFIGHGVADERANKQQSFDSNVSQVYLLVSTQVTYEQGMQQKIKKLHKQVTMNQIKASVNTKECCSNNLHELFEFGMFVCAIYLIVVLAQDQTTWIQKLVLICTIVYWMLQNYKLIIFVLIFALVPLIIIGIVIYVCVNSSAPRRQFTIPEAINPTNDQIINCGGTCTICMMDFDTASSVIFLPCSDKHMFHQLCIKGWLSLKSTCPNCRFDLSGDS